MRRLRWLFCALLVIVTLLAAASLWRGTEAKGQPKAGPSMNPGLVSLRIQLGLRDQQNTAWDGSITASPGRVAKMEIWRRGLEDAIEGNSWKVTTRPAPRFASRAQRGTVFPPAENGVIVTLDGVNESSVIVVSTKQGNFSFKLSDVPYGERFTALDGQADVLRIPVSYQLTAEGTEEDFPSATVGQDGTVYVAYVAFTHSRTFAKRYSFGPDVPAKQKPKEQPKELPKELPPLDEPTGGDQVFVMRLANNQWSTPMPVTSGGEDLYKTAIAVDGQGRPWVFWSAQQEGNWDLFASSMQNGAWSKPRRLTRDPGPDLNPAAAADSQGRVWLAWQGFRGDNSNILAMRLEGDRFAPETLISSDSANEWDPAIAAARSGGVAISWDTYKNGNYDVYFRVVKASGELGPVVPVAASLRQEVHSSVAYDGAGKLWVAWEQGPEQWGKDFGALVKDKGSPLYTGGERDVNVKCFQGEQPFQPADDLVAALAGGAERSAAAGAQAAPGKKGGAGKKGPGKKGGGAKQAGQAPQGALARQRSEERRTGQAVPHSLPRLATDSAGRVWLAYRARSPHFWSGVGTAWFEFLTCYDGRQWIAPVYVHNSDNLLENRPSLVSLAEGAMLLVNASDGRRDASGYQRSDVETVKPNKAEPVNNDVFVSSFGLPATPVEATVSAVAAETPAEPVGQPEKAAVARCRSYRLEIAGKSLRLMRGEFHRHTEISGDGGGDGSLIDMWRYALDASDMDWIGNGDHDNGGGREYSWWLTQKTTDAFTVGQWFTPVYSYERSVSYPDGHRNVIFPDRGIRTLPRFGRPGTGSDDQQPAHTPDTLLLYRYLEQYGGLCAVHTSGTDMGTDWRDNNSKVEPVVEIYQGCRQNYEEPGAPRAPSANDAIGGWRPNGFVWNALAKGYRLGFQASSDHTSTHISFCNVWSEQPSRDGIFKAMMARHAYGATDNIIADVRCGDRMMGDEFTTGEPPTLTIKLIGTAPFRRVDIVKDNTYVYNLTPGKQEVEFTWTDMAPGAGTSYYYVRGEQEDGELVWVSPMWITLKK